MDYNPFYYLVDLSRDAVFGSSAISWVVLGLMSLVAISILTVGALIFRKLQPGFADVI